MGERQEPNGDYSKNLSFRGHLVNEDWPLWSSENRWLVTLAILDKTKWAWTVLYRFVHVRVTGTTRWHVSHVMRATRSSIRFVWDDVDTWDSTLLNLLIDLLYDSERGEKKPSALTVKAINIRDAQSSHHKVREQRALFHNSLGLTHSRDAGREDGGDCGYEGVCVGVVRRGERYRCDSLDCLPW